MKMTQKQLSAWTTALRSGEYKQGRNRLKRIIGGNLNCEYCCLGVLEEIEGTPSRLSTRLCTVYLFGDNGASICLTDATADKYDCDSFGLEAPIDALTEAENIMVAKSGIYDKDNYNLAHLNDSGIPFSRIAELLEQYVTIIPEQENQQ